jgi:hypothetical protein
MDKADERAQAEMKELERKAKQAVEEGLSQTEDDEDDEKKPAPSMLDRRR